jgi:hypothetical protein
MEAVYCSRWRDVHWAPISAVSWLTPYDGILDRRNMWQDVEYQYIEGLMHLLVFSLTLRKCSVQNVKMHEVNLLNIPSETVSSHWHIIHLLTNSVNTFPITIAAKQGFKANSTKSYTNNDYKLNIANISCSSSAFVLYGNCRQKFSHVTPVRPTIDRLVTQLEGTGSVRVRVRACACVTNEQRNINVQ